MRPLRPSEIARRDQLLATAAAEASEPGHVVFVVDDAPAGIPCSLCDCRLPGDDMARHEADYCAGCAEPAAVIIRVFYATPDEIAPVVCSRHRDRAERIIGEILRRKFPEAEHVTVPGWQEPE